MFVTSDIFDLAKIARDDRRFDRDGRRFEWRENLLGSVAAHGTAWRGYQALATYLIAAARGLGLWGEMEYASYQREGDKRDRKIQPRSMDRLARGELVGAKDAEGVLFQGERAAEGSYRRSLLFGGYGSATPRLRRGPTGPSPVAKFPYRAFDTDFCFPLNERPRESAVELLKRSVEMLDAEYGYYYVRDDFGFLSGYSWGVGAATLGWGELKDQDTREISEWRDFVGEGALWTDPWPLLRDVFEVNLISERHTSKPLPGLGHLDEWIAARAGRGTLEELGRGRLLWTLTDEEMFNVRPLLNEAGALKSCLPRVYRDLPGAPPWVRLSKPQAGA